MKKDSNSRKLWQYDFLRRKSNFYWNLTSTLSMKDPLKCRYFIICNCTYEESLYLQNWVKMIEDILSFTVVRVKKFSHLQVYEWRYFLIYNCTYVNRYILIYKCISAEIYSFTNDKCTSWLTKMWILDIKKKQRFLPCLEFAQLQFVLFYQACIKKFYSVNLEKAQLKGRW